MRKSRIKKYTVTFPSLKQYKKVFAAKVNYLKKTIKNLPRALMERVKKVLYSRKRRHHRK